LSAAALSAPSAGCRYSSSKQPSLPSFLLLAPGLLLPRQQGTGSSRKKQGS
jgi:hypothetical protein